MIKILHVSAHENLFIEYQKKLTSQNIIFDYVLRKGGEDFQFKNTLNKNSKLFYVTPIQKNILKFTYELRKILKSEDYKYVHLHLSYANILGIIASINTSTKIISHNHSTYESRNTLFKLARILVLKPIINLFSSKKLACSNETGKQMFYKYEILPNSINYDKFLFSKNSRNKIRNQLNIKKNVFLIGHVGHFMDIKNHNYFLDFVSKNKFYINTKFLFIGFDLGTKEKFLKRAEELNLLNFFIVKDYVKNINEYYSAFDLFLFPSIKEGVPLSLIEAQVNGLKCFYSNSIDNEVKINNETISFDRFDFSNTNILNYINENNIGKRYTAFSYKFDIDKTFTILKDIYLN